MLRITVVQRTQQSGKSGKSGRFTMYKIRTDDGRCWNVTPEDLKEHIRNGTIFVTNMTLTSNGRLVKAYRGKKTTEKAPFRSSLDPRKPLESSQDADAIQESLEIKSDELKLFESLVVGQPFTYRLRNNGLDRWRQAIYVGRKEDTFYFIDETTSTGMSGFQKSFLSRQTQLDFKIDDNDPVKVEMLLKQNVFNTAG